MDKPDDEIAWPAVAAALRRYAARPEYREEIARMLAPLLTSYAFLPDYRRFFQIWEALRVHVSPVHFYSPIPDTRALPDALWERASDLPGIDMNEAGQLALLAAFRQFHDEYDVWPHEPTDDPRAFHY
ncbi:MAG TPA: hypothetical protein VFI22_08895, partial [Thermomicrobiales bacterium]|nr:hypothetical protein [Thermomicrobiales bacterium]